ncbi:sensor histidine kinase [Paenibacillus sp. Soil522]|uniref:sensor histidine kinase n=1 Tax=Paenibacillus sp. Soil522 TaxID=1736388 RepID=UPI0007011AE5|nr:sensor histidine kinase [Paenibacillus sp. Soil522]KRE48531.1 hypothetical protein ASG81_06580 [Paenibacillus sp. Soil522]
MIKARIGVQGNMFLIFSLLTLLLIISSFSFFYYYMSGRLEKEAIENMEQLTARMSKETDSFHSELNHITFQIIHNSEIIDIMRQAAESVYIENYFRNHSEAERKVKNYLATIKSPDFNISRISLYNDRGDYVSLGVAPADNDAIRAELKSDSFHAEYKRNIENDNINFIGPHADLFSNDETQKVVSFYRVFRNFMETFGMIEIQLSDSKFAETLDAPNIAEMQVYVFDKDGQLAYIRQGTETQEDITLKQLLGDQSTSYSVASMTRNLNQSNYILTYQKSPLSQWNIVLAAPKSVLLSSIKVVGRITVVVSIIFIILSFIMIFVITKQLTKRIRKISNLIRDASLDNPSIKTDDSNNEFILISRAFDSMFARLKDSMEQDVQARSRELRARINALEAQMNPHFLYNMLAVIGSAGEQAGVDKVMELCEKLARMFRYTSQHQDKEVTIRDEIMYAQLYLELMKERFEDYFQYRLEIDEATLSSKAPRLILQPLIENCFRHAFQKSSPPWVIHLSIKQTFDHSWLFEAKDWGDGFDPAVLEKLQRRMDSEDHYNADYSSEIKESSDNQDGVGLFNTLMRLRLTYDEQAFYEISTNHPTGTIVRIGVKHKSEL